jgi:hypothetical protein
MGLRQGSRFSVVSLSEFCWELLTRDKDDGMHQKSIGMKRLESSLVGTSANATSNEREREVRQQTAGRPRVCGNRGDRLGIVSKCSSMRGAHGAAISDTRSLLSRNKLPQKQQRIAEQMWLDPFKRCWEWQSVSAQLQQPSNERRLSAY